ncbi:hypothetical protein BKA83DRAFT_4049065, partial [Pisolithus microcarpus]
PVGALALATIAVERMFRQWKTGCYEVPPQRALCQFSNANWGFATNEVMTAIEKLTEKKWKKIFSGAEDYIGAHKPLATVEVTCSQMGFVSGRATCFEEDSE